MINVRKYQLLILSDGIPPFIRGGMQRHTKLLAEHVASSGVSVLLYHFLHIGQNVHEDDIRREFSEDANRNITFRTFFYPKEDAFPGHYIRGQFKMSKIYLDQLLVEDHIPILIFSKGFMAWELLSERERLPIDVKIAVKFHGMNMFQIQPNWKGELTKWMFRRPARRIMNSSDYVFSYGGDITKIIAHQLHDPEKIVELTTGVDRGWIAEQSNAGSHGPLTKFLFVGRMDRLKGLPELFSVLKNNPALNLSLTVVGPIPEKRRITDHRVHFSGEIIDKVALMKVYKEHDILVCPSISEGMPNVILEAMAQGLAVIATNVGATSVLVDHHVGWLIPAKEPAQLLSAMEEATQCMKLREKGNTAIKRVKENHVWEKIAASFVNWLKKENLF